MNQGAAYPTTGRNATRQYHNKYQSQWKHSVMDGGSLTPKAELSRVVGHPGSSACLLPRTGHRGRIDLREGRPDKEENAFRKWLHCLMGW